SIMYYLIAFMGQRFDCVKAIVVETAFFIFAVN
ncbi:uncharacterized protein METZ01_LOCUS480031, partial [marine metagenome]